MSEVCPPQEIIDGANHGAKPPGVEQGSQAAHPTRETDVEVYSVYGVEPEILAYAMAKYSRSALSMKESLKEISQQKAEKFLNTFYFQYGHRSIADLAHVGLAIERLSLLAAIAVVDEQRWDGQERSTRYQDFRKSGYFAPGFASGDATALYQKAAGQLFMEYEALSESTFHYLRERTAKPEQMKQDGYERTLRARAFDVSRYLLPLAANTSLGEIVNARTLETQIAHLLAHRHREVRNLGGLLKQAAVTPAHNGSQEALANLVEQIRAISPELAERAGRELLREVRVAPTLVKYADPDSYEIETRRELGHLARKLMGDRPIAAAPMVDLLDEEPLELELATTLIYEHIHHGYRQTREVLRAAGAATCREIIDLGLRHRGRHDEMARAFAAGQQFRFDILMDIGGFRDLHRHRRCIQIGQGFTTQHGYEVPPEVEASGALPRYEAVMREAQAYVEQIRQTGENEAEENSQYLIPLAFRKRTLFKMDFAEAVYISELRTAPAGHPSYRNAAYAMYEAVANKHPELAKYLRVTDVREPVDLLKR